MRKKVVILFLLIFILGFTPIDISSAITQSQIDAEVQIICTDGQNNWFSGSGTIIDPKGIILTNKHVVDGAYENTCIVGFINSISEEPNFGTTDNLNIAEVKYKTNTENMDAAILYLYNPNNIKYPYINIWESDSEKLSFGEKIEVIGFPGVGGSTITYTSGDFSGYGSESYGTKNYIKTTAQLEHGNSGGAAYNLNGEYIGIPTMVVPGELNSLSYILSINSIKKWLSVVLGNNYEESIIKNKPDTKQIISNIQNDITPPNVNNLTVSFLRYVKWNNGGDVFTQAGSHWIANTVVDKYNKLKISIGGASDKESGINGYYYYVGKNINANPVTEGKFEKSSGNEFQDINDVFTLEETGIYYFKIAVKDNSGNISNPFVARYVYEDNTYKDIKSISFFSDEMRNKNIGDYNFNFLYKESEKYLGDGQWSQLDSNKIVNDQLTCKTRLDNLFLSWKYAGNSNNESIVKVQNGDTFNSEGYGRILSLGEFEEGEIADNKFAIKSISKGEKASSFMTVYEPLNNLRYFEHPEFLKENQKIVFDFYVKPVSNNNILFDKHRLVSIVYEPNLDKDIVCVSGIDMYNGKIKTDDYPYLNFYAKNINHNSLQKTVIDYNLSKKLSGKILLQVEDNGEGWYVNPVNNKRYYLGRPTDAFNLMRELGLGISNNDFDSFGDYAPSRLSGKILLKVEDSGKAYYVNPVDLKMHYLGRPADAFNVMRDLGLGITNNDLRKIDIN